MCGIAGLIDLCGERRFSHHTLKRMSDAIVHRGPDEEGFYETPGVALASRRLSIVGLADGQQPIFNEDKSVVVVFNGEIFDFIEQRELLQAKGHRFSTHADTEVLVHMWEEYGEAMFDRLDGQFAFALYDNRHRTLVLGRDRLGISPLHWARRGDTIYFGSEIKAIFASGEVAPEADLQGIDHIFTFFAMGTRRTAFKNIEAVHPASYVKIRLGEGGRPGQITSRRYWDLAFPDAGDERNPRDAQALQAEFEATFRRAVEIRLRADVPVVGYLSGGVDSTTVMLAAKEVKGEPIPAFTIQIPAKGLDETDRALLAAERLGSRPTVVTCSSDVITAAYPKLIEAAEAPVMDTACSALYCLAREVRAGIQSGPDGRGGRRLVGRISLVQDCESAGSAGLRQFLARQLGASLGGQVATAPTCLGRNFALCKTAWGAPTASPICTVWSVFRGTAFIAEPCGKASASTPPGTTWT